MSALRCISTSLLKFAKSLLNFAKKMSAVRYREVSDFRLLEGLYTEKYETFDRDERSAFGLERRPSYSGARFRLRLYGEKLSRARGSPSQPRVYMRKKLTPSPSQELAFQ